MCRIAKVSRTAYYRSLKPSAAEIKRKEIVQAIRDVQEQNDYTLGVFSMQVELKSIGIELSHNTVDKYMSENGLHSKIRLRKFPKAYYVAMKDAMKNLPKNLLDRKFYVGVPRNTYVTDITYVPAVGGWIYKCVMKALCNNEILAWSLSYHPDTDLCIRTLNKLAEVRDLKGAIIHSDMGSTYTSKAYRKRLIELGAIQSMSRKAQCWDNACAESYFAIYKTECFGQRRKELLFHQIPKEEIFLLTDKWIKYYNEERKQKVLGWMSPRNYSIFYPHGNLLALPAPVEETTVA